MTHMLNKKCSATVLKNTVRSVLPVIKNSCNDSLKSTLSSYIFQKYALVFANKTNVPLQYAWLYPIQ